MAQAFVPALLEATLEDDVQQRLPLVVDMSTFLEDFSSTWSVVVDRTPVEALPLASPATLVSIALLPFAQAAFAQV